MRILVVLVTFVAVSALAAIILVDVRVVRTSYVATNIVEAVTNTVPMYCYDSTATARGLRYRSTLEFPQTTPSNAVHAAIFTDVAGWYRDQLHLDAQPGKLSLEAQ